MELREFEKSVLLLLYFQPLSLNCYVAVIFTFYNFVFIKYCCFRFSYLRNEFLATKERKRSSVRVCMRHNNNGRWGGLDLVDIMMTGLDAGRNIKSPIRRPCVCVLYTLFVCEFAWCVRLRCDTSSRTDQGHDIGFWLGPLIRTTFPLLPGFFYFDSPPVIPLMASAYSTGSWSSSPFTVTTILRISHLRLKCRLLLWKSNLTVHFYCTCGFTTAYYVQVFLV